MLRGGEQGVGGAAGAAPPIGIGGVLGVLREARPRWGAIGLGLVLGALMGGLGAVVPLGGKAVVDLLVMSSGAAATPPRAGAEWITTVAKYLGSPEAAIGALALCGALLGLLGLLQKWLIVGVQRDLSLGLQRALFDRVLGFPMGFFKRTRTGHLMERVLRDVAAVEYAVAEGLLWAFIRAVGAAAAMGIALSLSVKLGLVLGAALPIYFAISLLAARSVRAVSAQEREGAAVLSRTVGETLSGIETVKAYGGEAQAGRRMGADLGRTVALRARALLLQSFAGYAAAAVQFAAAMAVLLLGAGEVRAGTLGVGDFVALAAYVFYISHAGRAVFGYYVSMQPVMASMARIAELFAVGGEGGRGRSLEGIRGEVSFRSVTFGYGLGRPALREASFSAGPGEIVALAGPSGAGKTTAVNLLLKFYSPQGGGIELDGVDISELDTLWLRRRVSVVSQDIFLFDDTVENNIRYGAPWAARADVAASARAAGIHEEIEAMPEGYDTMVGERGKNLSEGQRQRVSFARALLKDSPVLVLDEPASALDPEAERILMETLASLRGKRTVLVIAHSLRTIGAAGRIVVLEGGEVRETGTHRELIEMGGTYARLFRDAKA